MSGIQEVLLILLILLGLVVIPRMIQRPRRIEARRPQSTLFTGKLRLAILATVAWMGLAAAYFQPWRNDWEGFVFAGAGLALLVWGAAWVIQGFRKRSR